jgi:hypothetical protein
VTKILFINEYEDIVEDDFQTRKYYKDSIELNREVKSRVYDNNIKVSNLYDIYGMQKNNIYVKSIT